LAVEIHFCGVTEHILSEICKRLLNTLLYGRVARQGSAHTRTLHLEDAEVYFGSCHDVVWFHMW